MGFTVRDLLPRIFAMRPDLDPGTIERGTQEAAKRVMRETFLGRVVQTVFPVKGGTNQILLSPQVAYWDSVTGKPFWVDYTNSSVEDNTMILPACMSGTSPDALTGIDPNPFQKTPCDILRIIRVRRANLPAQPPAKFKGFWTAQDGVLNPASYVQGDFLIAFGSFVLQTPTLIMFNVKSGDIIQIAPGGATWVQYPVELYDTVQQVNGPTVDTYTNRPKSPAGTNAYYIGAPGTHLPSNAVSVQWSQRNGQLGVLTAYGNTSNNLNLVRVQGDIWVTQTGNPAFVSMPASQYYTGPTYTGSAANLKINWAGPSGAYSSSFSTVLPVNEGHFDLYLEPGTYSAPTEDTTLVTPVPTSNTLVVDKGTNTARLYYNIPVTPGFVINVTPSTSTVTWTGGVQDNAPLVLTVTITRIDGFSDAIDLTLPIMNGTWDGFTATVNGVSINEFPSPHVMTSAPDSFTMVFEGTENGWSLNNWTTVMGGVQIEGVSGALDVLSNTFSVN